MDMTDRERFIEFLAGAGITFSDLGDVDCANAQVSPDITDLGDVARTISIGTSGPKNVGYGGFVADFYFDVDGKLLGTGVWE